MKCEYCDQKAVRTDLIGRSCCAECWEEVKDWTLEDQAKLEELSKEVCVKLDVEMAKILKENGLPPGTKNVIMCFGCRKPVQSDDGLLYCDCHDERK